VAVQSGDTVLKNLQTCLLLQSPRDRRALCEVVLATYRVELTTALSRIAGADGGEDDLQLVHDLASRIANTAESVQLRAVQNDAVTLQVRAAAAQDGGHDEQGAMLLAGLRVIDGILAAAPVQVADPAN
jgi:hypothetical protein